MCPMASHTFYKGVEMALSGLETAPGLSVEQMNRIVAIRSHLGYETELSAR